MTSGSLISVLHVVILMEHTLAGPQNPNRLGMAKLSWSSSDIR